jgi:periplasmic protein TonB
MNMYAESSLFSGRKGRALMAVILLHLVFGYAFYNELGERIGIKLAPPPLTLTPIEPPKHTAEPPPAMPPINQPRIFATQPEFPTFAPPSDSDVAVDQLPPDPPIMISQTPPPPHAGSPVRMDPRHPLRIGKDYYPDASVRADEMGRCVVQATVAADGRIIAAAIQVRSGFDRLDQACLNAVKGQRMLPATEDGKPIEGTVSIPITWNLSE